MYCYKCGKEIRDDSNYCPNCGAKIDSKNSKVYESTSKSQYDQRIKIDTNDYEFNIEDKKKFYFKYFLIGLIPIFGPIYFSSYKIQKDKERAKLTSLYAGSVCSMFLVFIIVTVVFLIIFLKFKHNF